MFEAIGVLVVIGLGALFILGSIGWAFMGEFAVVKNDKSFYHKMALACLVIGFILLYLGFEPVNISID